MSDELIHKRPYRGKSEQPLEWGGVLFTFPFHLFLPDPTEETRRALQEDIRTAGVREPISIVIGKRFHLAGEAPVSISGLEPPMMLCIEEERLKMVERLGGRGKQAAEVIEPPKVAVVDGEVRLRLAASLGIPLEEIPFRLYTDPPEARDKQLRDVLKNNTERQEYDELDETQKRRFRLVFDLWQLSTTRRGGLSDSGYSKMILTVDRLFHRRFQRLSHRKMANLLHTNRNKVKSLRTNIAAQHRGGSALLNRMNRLQREKDHASSSASRLAGIWDDMKMRDFEGSATEEDFEGFERIVADQRNYYRQRIKDINERFNDQFESRYEELVAGGLGPIEAFFETGRSVAEMMDDFIDGTSEIDYDEYFEGLDLEEVSDAE